MKHSTAATCPTCSSVLVPMGADALQPREHVEPGSPKRILPAALLAFLFGVFGAHRFYAGKTGTAIIQLLTLGGLGIWAMIDLVLIIVGAFTDADGRKITEWT
ncbi:MAG: TM2 domain-containing protein [Gemmatimonadota bacterium]